jgi:hypothetical protein
VSTHGDASMGLSGISKQFRKGNSPKFAKRKLRRTTVDGILLSEGKDAPLRVLLEAGRKGGVAP